MRTDCFGVRRWSSTSGVLPTSSSSDEAMFRLRLSTGHGRQQDDRCPVANGRLDPVERAHVLAFDVDVHERRDVVVLDELRAQPWEARHQVVEQLADGVAACRNLPLAANLLPQRRWNANGRHACVGLPWQNSTYSMYSVMDGW